MVCNIFVIIGGGRENCQSLTNELAFTLNRSGQNSSPKLNFLNFAEACFDLPKTTTSSMANKHLSFGFRPQGRYEERNLKPCVDL
jgi:hypothetical protein